MSLETDKTSLYYRIHVFACTNSRDPALAKVSCGAQGSGQLRDYMKAKAKDLGLNDVRINTSGCLNRCKYGPVMVIYPEGVWYAFRTSEDVDEILQTHVINGGRVDRLLIKTMTE